MTRADDAALEEEVAELRLQLNCERAVLSMAVARLGGLVEGRPTHTGNFLQRIDELRRIERAQSMPINFIMLGVYLLIGSLTGVLIGGLISGLRLSKW